VEATQIDGLCGELEALHNLSNPDVPPLPRALWPSAGVQPDKRACNAAQREHRFFAALKPPFQND
jgi:hypothetical protein